MTNCEQEDRVSTRVVPLLCRVGTESWRLARETGLRVILEAFVDRAYTPEGLRQPRAALEGARVELACGAVR
jgi:UPF0271 protein